MSSDPILYNSDQPDNLIVSRPAVALGGLAGFLIKKGWASSPKQANVVLVVISLVLITLAIVIPFIW
ncbi:MAG: hypothetical protein K8Q91_03100 [Candidatus Vogelbacteria bacterium]|nr:hypothetical protein [Candidatus Vogelbacteria bacterium]